MTNPSIIPTKISIPRLREAVVQRARLVEVLNVGLKRSAGLTLVSAPAGYGKTTLAAGWLGGFKRRSAWYSLGREDDNFLHFITHLIFSLRKVQPSLGQSILEHFLDGFHSEPSRAGGILSSLIQDLARRARPMILVLEDYHFIESKAIHEFVGNLIEHTIPHLHIVLTSRSDPPLPLAKWRARGWLTEIRAPDLQFTLEESTKFIEQVMDLTLSHQQIRLLQSRTEGWVAGLQLAALSIRTHPGRLDTWTLEDGQRDIADYLMAEVLGHLPAERREFLLQTSIAGRLCAPLCNAITGRKDSQHMLEALDSENIFTIPLDNSREWYRYHPLFAGFLCKQLIAGAPQDVVIGLHRRASRWLAEHGFITEAIDHAVAGNDHEYAACLIEPQAEQLIRRGETSTILKQLNRLPKPFAWNRWSSCLWYGWAWAVKGDIASAARWTNRVEALIMPLIREAAFEENGSPSEDLYTAYVQVLAIRSLIARQNREFPLAMALGEQALRLVPEDNVNLQTILSAIYSSAVMDAGRFDQAEGLLQSTRKNAPRAGNPFITFTVLLNESALAMMRGQLHRAYDLNGDALRLARTGSMERLAFLAQFRLGRIHYFWNRLSQANEYVQEAIEGADVKEYPNPTIRGYITLAWIQNAEGQYPQALATLDNAERIASDQHLWESVEMVGGVRAQLLISDGEQQAANRWLRSSGWESFHSSGPGLIVSDESFFPFCQMLIASQDPREWRRAGQLLAWRLADSERQRRNSTILKIRLMQALLDQAKDQTDTAMTSLLQALELAMPETCVRPFLDEGRALMPLLRRVSQNHPAFTFAQKLVSIHSANRQDDLQSMVESLSEQELKVLRLMAQGHTNPEIAGRLVLAVSTVRWYAKQIFRKLGVHNRTQAAAQARELNLM